MSEKVIKVYSLREENNQKIYRKNSLRNYYDWLPPDFEEKKANKQKTNKFLNLKLVSLL